MNKKYLLIGRGLAGSILSFKLMEENIAHDIMDQPGISVSSKVAAGIINPLVLKRLKIVYNAEGFLKPAVDFYSSLENNHGASFLHRINIRHIFHSIGEVNHWLEKSANGPHTLFLGDTGKEGPLTTRMPYGWGEVLNTAWLDTNTFLSLHREAFLQTGELFHQKMTTGMLPGLIKEYGKVILCNGHSVREVIPGIKKVFSPTRGEVLTIEAPDLDEDFIYHGPVFILPLGNGFFKVGATYHWDQLEDKTTVNAKEELVEKLTSIFTGKFRIVDHQAGVRPNTIDRKPILGNLNDNLFIFNGLGSRGALMAPLLADLMVSFLEKNKPLPPEFDIQRFG